MQTMKVATQDHAALICRFIDVYNEALARNKDRFPFKQILGAAEKAHKGKAIELDLLEDTKSLHYTLLFKGQRLAILPYIVPCDYRWVMEKNEVENLINHAEEYIKNPAKLDWAWLYKKISE